MRPGRLGLQYGIPRAASGGRGTRVIMAKPKRGKLSLAESSVTPSLGVRWLQACGRSNTREAALPSDMTLALSVQTWLKIPSIDYDKMRSYVKSQLGPIAQSWSLYR